MQNDLSVDQDPTDTRWIGVWHVVSGPISDMLRIKYHQVSFVTRTYESSIAQAETPGSQPGHPVNRFLKGNRAAFAHIRAQNTWKGPIGPGMWVTLPEHTIGCGGTCIGTDHHLGVL